jgi:hypothetical protein
MVRILVTSRSDPARPHALSRRDVGGMRCKNSESATHQSKKVYVTSRNKVRHQVHLPHNDDAKKVDHTENETQQQAADKGFTSFVSRPPTTVGEVGALRWRCSA